MPHTIDIIPYNTHYVYLAAIVCGQKMPLRKANILRALLASILVRDVRRRFTSVQSLRQARISSPQALDVLWMVRRQLMHSEYVEVVRMYDSWVENRKMRITMRNETRLKIRPRKKKEGAASTSKQAQATETSALSTLFSAQTWREKASPASSTRAVHQCGGSRLPLRHEQRVSI